MAEKYKPYTTFSIDAEIEAGKDLDLSEETLSYKQKIASSDDEIVIRYHNVITKYVDALKEYIVDYEMDDDEYYRYKYQPKLFCYEAYGTPELSTSLLYINNMPSMIDFTKQKIKAFNTDIKSAIDELLAIEESDMLINRNDLNASK